MKIPGFSLFAAALFLLGAQDIDKILEKADKILEESKTAYENARTNSSVPMFVEAGFKLEEARIKYLAIQEIGSPDQQKAAADRLRAVNQLAKLIHDGKVAVNAPLSDNPAAPPPPPLPLPAPDPAKPAEPRAKIAADIISRVPVPEAGRLKDAEKTIRELFKDQYAKKAPTDRQTLARTLLEQARKVTDDPAAAWVLYREAQDIAIQAGDMTTMVAAIDGASAAFDVDAMALKSGALAAAGKTAKALPEFATLADALLKLADEFVAADQYDWADKTAAAALQNARRANDATLVNRATARSKEIAEAKTKFASLKRVLETLARNPDDPAANLEMGQFLCFIKGNWELGPRFLVKGSDAALKAVAEKELALPVQPADRVAVADGWWDLGVKESSPLRKNQILLHAGSLYEAVLPEVSGLAKIKIDKRLETYYQYLPSGPAVDLLKLIDPRRDSVEGDWKMEKDALIVPAGRKTAGLQIPYSPPEEYDLRMVIARRSGFQDIYTGLVIGGKQLLTHVDSGPRGDEGGVERLDGKSWIDNEVKYSGSKFFNDDRPHVLLYSVRKSALTISGDGRPLMRWKTDVKRITPSNLCPNQTAMYLGNWETSFEISQMLLFPVSGQGQKLGHVR
ncbi:MAG: hypothetical protein HY293_02775 [Planctomycetes bacterium]|nr:hypothetical protein [Planctomycetota bacterium]